MRDLIVKWKQQAENYKIAEDDTELAFHTRSMAKHKKEVFLKCVSDLEGVEIREIIK